MIQWLLTLFTHKYGPWTDMSTGKDTEHEHFYVLQSRRRDDGKIQLRVEKTFTSCVANEITLADLSRAQFIHQTI